MRKIANKLISKIKKEEYVIDKTMTSFDIFKYFFNRFIMNFRGIFKKNGMKKRPKYLFIGKNTKISYKNKIKCKRTITIGNNCYINALSKEGIKFGNNFKLGDNSIIECTGVIKNLGEELIIGDNVGISANAFIGVRGKIEIGNDVIIGPFFNIHSENHIFDKDSIIRNQGEKRDGIKIGNNCWIGSNVTILDGVTIGDGVVIGAGSVVTKNIPENVVIAGVPAKILKKR